MPLRWLTLSFAARRSSGARYEGAAQHALTRLTTRVAGTPPGICYAMPLHSASDVSPSDADEAQYRVTIFTLMPPLQHCARHAFFSPARRKELSPRKSTANQRFRR